jgi:hypothetical protein
LVLRSHDQPSAYEQSDVTSGESTYLMEKWGFVPRSERSQRTIPVEAGEELILRDGRLEYKAKSLSRLLHLELLSIPPARLRTCVRPGCNTPYFVAHHLGQRYCTESCARWAQGEWKRKWWNEFGAEWRLRKTKNQPKTVAKK